MFRFSLREEFNGANDAVCLSKFLTAALKLIPIAAGMADERGGQRIYCLGARLCGKDPGLAGKIEIYKFWCKT